MPEDAEEAAKKLNHKEFFGKVVSVEVAKPKKRGFMLYWRIINRKSGNNQKGKEGENPNNEWFETGRDYSAYAYNCGIWNTCSIIKGNIREEVSWLNDSSF